MQHTTSRRAVMLVAATALAAPALAMISTTADTEILAISRPPGPLIEGWQAFAVSTIAPDPIFAAIERYDIAYNATLASYQARADIERRVPMEGLNSNWDCWDGLRLDPNDPEEYCNAITKSWNDHLEEDSALLGLLKTAPTTLPGIVALLEYAHDHDGYDENGEQDCSSLFDRGNAEIAEASANFYLHLAESLRAIGGVS